MAVGAGAILPFAFAPFQQNWIVLLSLAVLFFLWKRSDSRKQAAWLGFGFGIGMFGIGVSWIQFSMFQFGNTGFVLSIMMTVLFVVVVSFYIALVGWIAVWLLEKKDNSDNYGNFWGISLLFPALWVAGEWLRSHLFTGFPWLLLGHTAPGSLYAGLAPIVGTYGVSFFLAWSAMWLMLLVVDQQRKKQIFRLGMLLLIWAAAWGSGQRDWHQPKGEPLDVALVQGNIAQNLKWRSEVRQTILAHYRRSVEAVDADLYIWPETALPAFRDQIEDDFLVPLAKQLAEKKQSLLLGIVARDKHQNDRKQHDQNRRLNQRVYFNSLQLIGAEEGEYRKRHLVPFGEYLPLKAYFSEFLRFMEIPMADFSAGKALQKPMAISGNHFSSTICYEIVYPNLVFDHLPEATFLVTVSNDAWFGDSLAPHQHLQIAQMRALESARPLLRATNSGITAVISPKGEIVAQLPQFQSGVLVDQMQPVSGRTPYIWWGDWPVFLLITLIVGIAVWQRRKSRV